MNEKLEANLIHIEIKCIHLSTYIYIFVCVYSVLYFNSTIKSLSIYISIQPLLLYSKIFIANIYLY